MPGRGWLRRVGPWVGIGTSPAALMLGGGVAEGIAGWRLILALALGACLLALLAAIQGMLGQRTGRALLGLTDGPLGTRASHLIASPAMLAMMLGWFALNTSVAGTALGRLVGLPDRVGMALFGMLMLAVVWFGVNALSWGALAAGVATVVIAVQGIRLVAAGRDIDPLAGTAFEPIGLVPALALVVGYGAAFALRTPDFTRDLGRPRHVLWCAVAGLLAPVVCFALVGAVLQQSTGTWNLADVLRDLGSPTVAYLFVAIGFAGSVMTNLYSGALSLSDALPRVGHRAALGLVCAAGTALAALRFSQWMLPYLTTMALAAPPLAALCWIHHRRGRTASPAPWRPAGIAAWGAGVAVGLALHAAGSGLALPAGFAAAAVLGLGAERIARA